MSRHRDTDSSFDEHPPRRRRRRKRSTDETGADASSTRSRRNSESKRRKWPWVLLGLCLFVFFLPNLIGLAGLQQFAIDYSLSDFKGKVSVDSVSMGWFQPIKLTNLHATDVDGESIVQIADVTTTRSLFSLLTGDDYGQIHVQSPIVYLDLRADGSNLEDAIGNYIPASPGEPALPNPEPAQPFPLPKLVVNVHDGQVVVSASTTKKSWQISELNAVAKTAAESAPLDIDVQCVVTPGVPNENGQTILLNAGGLGISGKIDPGADTLSFGSADIALETQNLPLSLIAPVLQRFIGKTDSDGRVNGTLQAAYNAHSNSANVSIQQLTLKGVGVTAPELIGSDRLAIDSLSAQGTLQISPTVISADQFNIKSPVGKVTADGSFDLNQLTNLANSGQLLDTPFRMDGEIDLARLIQMFPSSLQLHQDLEVMSGKVNFYANSRSENGNRRLVLNLDTANLQARRGNQNIAWAQPLRLVGTVHQSAGRLALEEVRCESDFLSINGNATLETASFLVEGDLERLMENVGQFVDLQGTQLGGRLKGSFGWQVGNPNDVQGPLTDITNLPIQIGGSFLVDNPVAVLPGMKRWQQPQMSVRVSASGRSPDGSRLQLDQGGVQVDIGAEQLVATLAGPVADAMAQTQWDTNCRMTGGLAGWVGHVQNFVDLGEIDAQGNLQLKCATSIDANSIQLSQIDYQVQQLVFDGYGMKIREAKAIGTAEVQYDFASGTTTIADTTLSASSISARGNQIKISFPSNMQIEGQVAFQGDVNRMADWFELSSTPESIFWYGTIDGQIQLASNENGIGGRVRSTITDLVAAKQVKIAPPAPTQGQIIQASQAKVGWQEIWREQTVAITGDVSLTNDFNAVGFQNLLLDASGLKVKANGSISDLATSMFADLGGTWQPNWEKINTILHAYTGNFLRFAGQEEHQFAIRGPIADITATSESPNCPFVPASLQAATSFGWERGEILNLPVGASQMQLDVNESVAVLKTNGIPFAGGMVNFAPKIDMRSQDPAMIMDWTRVIDNVALRPETARQWLRFVAPLAADATSAQGNFTVDIGSAKVPLFDPMNMEVRGSVKLHDVSIGAGPAAEQLLSTVTQLKTILNPGSPNRDLTTWLRMKEQTVPIAIKNGRVYHNKLDFAHDDLVIQTHGSVGLDQTLNMVAKIPIADAWIAGKPYLASLKGQTISVPITGTVTQPRLDKRALQQLSTNLVKQGVNGALNKVIDDKVAPKVNEFQDQLNNRFNNELNKFQNKLNDQLGGALMKNGSPPHNQPAPGYPTLEDQVGDKLEDALNKGIKNLFGK